MVSLEQIKQALSFSSLAMTNSSFMVPQNLESARRPT
jgi:hypothetical protein